jgi:Ca2+-binding EF-hand superfamily protein
MGLIAEPSEIQKIRDIFYELDVDQNGDLETTDLKERKRSDSKKLEKGEVKD